MSEPEFLNRLHRGGYSDILLDLHNLYVCWRNDGWSPSEYIGALDPDAVVEIHLGGGDDFAEFYRDSHSSLTPPEVWQWAFDYVPRFKGLRAITFKFQETYYERLGPSLVRRIEAYARVGRLLLHPGEVACAG